MPSKVRILINKARELPIMDSTNKSTDAYVELKISGVFSEKTDVIFKDLNPTWNKEFIVNVKNDGTLQKHPLEIKVWDRDTLSSDDIIGTILIDLSNLIHNEGGQIVGWFPLFDTFRGNRGELHVSIDLEYIPSKNTDYDGLIKFISSSNTFNNVIIEDIHGFVEELEIEDDPEYNWKDNFRTPRISNAARQYLLYKLSGKLKRDISKKVRALGGNAVIGYQNHVEFEEEGFVTARAYGTAVTLKNRTRQDINDSTSSIEFMDNEENIDLNSSTNLKRDKSFYMKQLQSGDIQLLTIDSFPYPIQYKIGGIVSARSIKLIPKNMKSEDKGRALRDKWWTELREEIKSHAKGLNCQYVIGYIEKTNVRDGVIVLSASGTAVKVSLPTKDNSLNSNIDNELQPPNEISKSLPKSFHSSEEEIIENTQLKKVDYRCYPCHIPYKASDLPFPMKISTCNICNKGLVPEILLSTIEPPTGLQMLGHGELIEAYVCRSKKKCQGEADAQQLSKLIPFLEYDLHKQIILKLRLLGMNACFSLETQIREGDDVVIAFAHGTAVHISALPKPQPLKLKRSDSFLVSKFKKISKLNETFNEELNTKPHDSYPDVQFQDNTEIDITDGTNMDDVLFPTVSENVGFIRNNSNDSIDAYDVLTISSSQAGSSVSVELDEKIDDEIINSLLSHGTREKELSVVNTEIVPGLKTSSLHNMGQLTFFQVIDWDKPNGRTDTNKLFSIIFNSLYKNLHFRLKPFYPCCLCGVNIDIQVPDDNDIQILFTATLLHVSPEQKVKDKKKKRSKIEQQIKSSVCIPPVEITTLSYIPGSKIEKFLGRISIGFIKESFSIREQGGMNTFTNKFLLEMRSIAQAHVRALGGNVLLSYHIDQAKFTSKESKNRAYCMINITGDAVLVSHSKQCKKGYQKLAYVNNTI